MIFGLTLPLRYGKLKKVSGCPGGAELLIIRKVEDVYVKHCERRGYGKLNICRAEVFPLGVCPQAGERLPAYLPYWVLDIILSFHHMRYS